MTKIYLIRHTQAEGNLYRMMQGHWDGDVTSEGLRQIDALEKRFEGIKVDAAYSSDLHRAKMTAGAICRSRGLTLHTDRRLRELNMGPWEAQFFGNVFYSQPTETEYFIRDPEKWHIEGAETFEQVGQRAYRALLEIAKAHPGETVAVVSHGVTIRCLISRICNYPLNDIDNNPIFKNTAVSLLDFDGDTFKAEYVNDYSHILPLGQPRWSNTPDLRDECFDPAMDAKFYTDCYADAWLAAHGSLKGYSPEPYYASAVEHRAVNPRSVMRIYDKELSAGLVDLDTAYGAQAGWGWISLLYLKPEYRGQGCGIQLLGRALRLYSELGRKYLRLNVAKANDRAFNFYLKNGFTVVDSTVNSLGTLYQMERSIRSVEEDV